MIGRVLRPAEGKPDAIVLDHSGAVFRHGFVEDHVEWTLDPDRRAAHPSTSAALRPIMRRGCSNARNAAPSAPPASRAAHCGFLPQRPPRAVSISSTAISPRQRRKAHRRQQLRSERARALARDADLHRRRTRTTSRAGSLTSTKKNSARCPRGALRPQPIAPTPEVRSWVRSRQIAFAKRQVGMKTQRNKIDGQFAPRTIAMLRSPAMRALSLSAPSHS